MAAFNAAAMAEKKVKEGDSGAAWYVLGSAALLETRRRLEDGAGEEEGPSFIQRVAATIPFRNGSVVEEKAG